MQEPVRYNMFSAIQKNLKAVQRKIYLHRIIYAASYVNDPAVNNQGEKAFIILIDSNIKLINEDYCEDKITGFGLFYSSYFINIIEGPQSALVKHLEILSETLDKNLSKTPEVTRMKILLMSYHINERHFTSWNGRHATPPVLLDKIAPNTSPEVNVRHLQNCLLKLHKVSEFLRNQPQNLLKAAMDNISDLCRACLPEINLLDFLLNSPGLMNVGKFIQKYQKVPEFTLYHETVWPLPSDFVPYTVLKDSSKELMSLGMSKSNSGNYQESDETKTELKV